jgi:hypothetical protein
MYIVALAPVPSLDKEGDLNAIAPLWLIEMQRVLNWKEGKYEETKNSPAHLFSRAPVSWIRESSIFQCYAAL